MLARIRALAVPPAWDGRLDLPRPARPPPGDRSRRAGPQAVPLPPALAGARETAKFERLVAFGRALPAIRRRVDRDLARPGLPREKVLAPVVRLLELTLIRVGNEEYARLNRSFGLTTMRGPTRDGPRARVVFRFRGKGARRTRSGSPTVAWRDSSAAARTCPARSCSSTSTPTGPSGMSTSDDVNEYIRSISGADFTAKDFRTWAGDHTRVTRAPRPDDVVEGRAAKRAVAGAIAEVADTSATHRPSAGPATSTRPSSTPISTGPSLASPTPTTTGRSRGPRRHQPRRQRSSACCGVIDARDGPSRRVRARGQRLAARSGASVSENGTTRPGAGGSFGAKAHPEGHSGVCLAGPAASREGDDRRH